MISTAHAKLPTLGQVTTLLWMLVVAVGISLPVLGYEFRSSLVFRVGKSQYISTHDLSVAHMLSTLELRGSAPVAAPNGNEERELAKKLLRRYLWLEELRGLRWTDYDLTQYEQLTDKLRASATSNGLTRELSDDVVERYVREKLMIAAYIRQRIEPLVSVDEVAIVERLQQMGFPADAKGGAVAALRQEIVNELTFTQLAEKIRGRLERLLDRHAIVVLDERFDDLRLLEAMQEFVVGQARAAKSLGTTEDSLPATPTSAAVPTTMGTDPTAAGVTATTAPTP